MSGIYLNATSALASNPYSSFVSTQALANQILSDPSFASVNAFLNYPDASNNSSGYDDAYRVLGAYVNKLASNGVSYKNNGFKFLLALDDGTVIIDTSKSDNVTTTKTIGSVASGTSVAPNSAAAYGCKLVNTDNHNSRPEVLNAVLSASGVGTARRFSSSSQSAFQYYAVRLGNSPQSNLGTLRIAAQEYNTASNVSGKPGSAFDL